MERLQKIFLDNLIDCTFTAQGLWSVLSYFNISKMSSRNDFVTVRIKNGEIISEHEKQLRKIEIIGGVSLEVVRKFRGPRNFFSMIKKQNLSTQHRAPSDQIVFSLRGGNFSQNALVLDDEDLKRLRPFLKPVIETHGLFFSRDSKGVHLEGKIIKITKG